MHERIEPEEQGAERIDITSFAARRGLCGVMSSRRIGTPTDFPGFGYSGMPDRTRFDDTFDGYANFLERFMAVMNLTCYALYLHDYGSQIGLRLAIKAPERVAALIIQNGAIYEDELGPRYVVLKDYWANPTPERHAKLAEAVSEEGFRDEFLYGVGKGFVGLNGRQPQICLRAHGVLQRLRLL